MSKTHKKLSRPIAKKQWFLKLEDGQVFGPSDTSTIIDWAHQGRITPGHQLSEDKKAWVAAERIPELKMVWMVELSDGSYFGPLNIRALADLLDDEAITLDAKIINQHTNETATIAERKQEIYDKTPIPKDIPIKPITAVGAGLVPTLSTTKAKTTDKGNAQLSEQTTEPQAKTTKDQRPETKDQRLESQYAALKKQAAQEREATEHAQQQSATVEKSLRERIDILESEKQKISLDLTKTGNDLKKAKAAQATQVDWTGGKKEAKPDKDELSEQQIKEQEAKLKKHIDELKTESGVTAAKLKQTESQLKTESDKNLALKDKTKTLEEKLTKQIAELKNYTT